MKKLIALLLCTVLLTALLAACGNDTPDTLEPELPTIPDTPTPPPQANDDFVYINEYLGFKITIPGDWTVEIGDEMYDGFFIAMEAHSPIVMDTEGSSPVFSLASVLITYQRLVFPKSAAQYAEALATVLQAVGVIEEFDLIPDTTRIGNHEWASFASRSDGFLGSTDYSRSFFSMHEDFVWMIKITYTDGFGSLDDILAMFSDI